MNTIREFIDNGPNLDFSFDNAIIASNDYIVPVKIDKWAFYGVSFVQQRVKAMSSTGTLI